MKNSSKPHIGIYGCCNAGKSSFLNFIVGENLSIVSPVGGTTTDPVKRSFEILDFAPVVAIDTAGYDDTSLLGVERIAKTKESLNHIDLAILIYRDKWQQADTDFLNLIKSEGLNYLIIKNTIDNCEISNENRVILSNFATKEERDIIMQHIKNVLPKHSYTNYSMLGDKIEKNDIILLVCPIDSEAPSGRIILPQVQALRDALDNFAISVVIQPEQIKATLESGIVPKLIVTDSQVIDFVLESIPLELKERVTTFSILLAELKGDVTLYKKGLEQVKKLKEGDKILLLESCVHQTSCEDIGRVKIPRWLNDYTGVELDYSFLSGLSPLPTDIDKYSLVIQCGGCMVTARQLKSRIARVANRGVAITNYGMLIKMIRA